MGPQTVTVVKQGNTRPKAAHRRLPVVMSERLILPHEENRTFSVGDSQTHPCSDHRDRESLTLCGVSQSIPVTIILLVKKNLH